MARRKDAVVPVAPQVAQPEAPRKIAILGKAPSSLNLAPFDDPEWEIWGLGDLWRQISGKRYSRWFELHDIESGRARWKPDYFEWLKTAANLVIQKPHPELPNAAVYPLPEVLQRFGGYFTNSISWEIALALYEGNVSHLAVYGVDMATSDGGVTGNGEYEHQRPSCEYFIGLARGMGVDVYIPPQSDLMKTSRLYAFETHCSDAFNKHRAREMELKARLAQEESKRDGAAQAALVIQGALQDLQWHKPWIR